MVYRIFKTVNILVFLLILNSISKTNTNYLTNGIIYKSNNRIIFKIEPLYDYCNLSSNNTLQENVYSHSYASVKSDIKFFQNVLKEIINLETKQYIIFNDRYEILLRKVYIILNSEVPDP